MSRVDAQSRSEPDRFDAASMITADEARRLLPELTAVALSGGSVDEAITAAQIVPPGCDECLHEWHHCCWWDWDKRHEQPAARRVTTWTTKLYWQINGDGRAGTSEQWHAAVVAAAIRDCTTVLAPT